MIYLGDSTQKLKELEANSIDSVVCDPPYFLTNNGGSGFMGKEWDSLSIKNAFAESVLRSLKPVFLLDVVNSVLENVSTNSKKKKQENCIRALHVERKSIDRQARLSLSTFSVLENVLTKAEVLVLSKELCPSLTTVFENHQDNVLYAVPILFTQNQPSVIAQELALKLHTKDVCEEIEILLTLMEDPKTKILIEEMTGRKFDSKFIAETTSNAKSAVSIALEKRYNVTTSSHIESQKIIQWITSLPYVRNAMRKFMLNPSNIQTLSERFHYNWLTEVYRVMKPGAHLLAFAGTRTYGRLAVAVELAGFEIRDQLQWVFGSGFPKSHNLKEEWQGWGTALKPANEPIVLARKPLSEKTVAENVLRWGTGAINVDESRIEYLSELDRSSATPQGKCTSQGLVGNNGKPRNEFDRPELKGRWPANVLFDEDAAEMLDAQSGVTKSGDLTGQPRTENKIYGSAANTLGTPRFHKGDSGGASRFFYVAKASKSERNRGLEGMPNKILARSGGAQARAAKGESYDNGDSSFNKTIECKNHHPTVKPIKLMQYLIKLVTPKGGTVLDPFMGSGSTGVAAFSLNFKFIGIELNEEYIEIAKKRLSHIQQEFTA